MISFKKSLEQCHGFILEHGLLSPGDRVVVAVSGGADSVFLFYLFLELADRMDLELIVAHLNHGLRPEAVEEAEFVRNLCRDNRVAFHTAEIPFGTLTSVPGYSIEMAAREKRRQFLVAAADTYRASRIALGHTASDSIETMLMNIHRGSGLRGISGMPPKAGRIIRPLIFMDRGEIRRILGDAAIPFIEDRSNRNTEFLRNRVRIRLIPQFSAVFGDNFPAKWQQLSENARNSMTAMRTLLRHFLLPFAQWGQCGVRVKRVAFQDMDNSLLTETILFLLEETAGSTYFVTGKKLGQIADFVKGRGFGEIQVHPKSGLRVVRSGQHIYFLKKEPDISLKIAAPGTYISWFQEELVFSRVGKSDDSSELSPILFLNEKHFPFPFKFSPVEMENDIIFRGGRKIRDIRNFLKKAGVGKLEREKMPVLKHKRRILWIPGLAPLLEKSEMGIFTDQRIAVYFKAHMG